MSGINLTNFLLCSRGINLTNYFLFSNKTYLWNYRVSQKNSCPRWKLEQMIPRGPFQLQPLWFCENLLPREEQSQEAQPSLLELKDGWHFRDHGKPSVQLPLPLGNVLDLLLTLRQELGEVPTCHLVPPHCIYKAAPLGTHFWPLTINGTLSHYCRAKWQDHPS